MTQDYWIKQSLDKPAFPDLLWSRPENQQHAGKILIIGGNAHSFAAPAEAYTKVLDGGAGAMRTLMPDSIKKLIKGVLPEADFAPSTPSGSFAVRALDEILTNCHWADVVLLAGDFGRNSETAILIEKIISKTTKPLVATKDAADYIVNLVKVVAGREDLTLVMTIAELQKLAVNLKYKSAVKFEMGLLELVDFLHDFTSENLVNIVIGHLDNIFVASGGKVSTTKISMSNDFWRLPTASSASVWLAQNPTKPFEALTTSVFKAT